MMTQTFPALLLFIIAVSALHAILPTHWLPFVAVGRGLGWSKGKIMRVLIVAGTGHVLTTALLGLLTVSLSKYLLSMISNMHGIFSAVLLSVFGLFYILIPLRKGGHPECSHNHKDDIVDKSAALSLFMMLSLSPCESAIPIYFAAGDLPWQMVIILIIASGIATIIGMLVLTNLALLGIEKVKFHFLEHNERLIMGIILILTAAILFVIEYAHK